MENPINFTYTAVVSNVVDGDTIDADLDLGFHMLCRQRIRLLGIDAAEKGQRGAKEATAFLRQFIGKPLWVKTQKSDSFGRYLGVLFCAFTGMNINQRMIEMGLARLWSK